MSAPAKPDNYFAKARLEMLPFVPKSAALVLDVGCSQGRFGAALKRELPQAKVWGVEPDPAAQTEAAARRDAAGAGLREALARVLANAEGVDETRLAQELAMIAVKTDVTEELDRLTAHIAAARTLLADQGQIGRKFDFLMQEFMREANTLCSKAQSLTLTRIGLDLKTTIDQMREQVQNVE